MEQTNNIQIKKIGEILEDLNYVTKEQIEVALNVKKNTTKLLGEVLQDLDFVTSIEIAEAVAKQEKTKFSLIINEKIEENLLKLIPKNVCESNSIFPLHFQDDGSVIIVKNHESNIYLDDYIKKYINNRKILYYISDKKTIHKAIQTYYQDNIDEFNIYIDNINKNKEKADQNIELMFKMLFADALKKRVSDIHITPEDDKVYIFYRIDGVLKYRCSISKELHKRLEGNIKVRAEMGVGSVMSSEDGRFSFEHLDEKFDIRVSILNLNNVGSNIVLRILSKNNSVFNLSALGIDNFYNEKLKNYINKPHGIILVSGPTGSGKTTTLYSMLRKVNSLQKNILTVEDPIEYKFSFIRQTQINEAASYGFPEAIRTFMRQDPDVILVGEIRDQETAELTIRAALTGHLVISTVHTNDAVSTIPRLLDLGIKEYMISSSVLAIVSQRLVRRLCNSCKKEKFYTKEELYEHSFLKDYSKKEIFNEGIKSYEPFGCKFCNNTGYNGREAVIELLEIDKQIQEMIIKNNSTLEIEDYAKSKGMKTIKDNSIEKFIDGITSINEIERVIK